MRRKNFFNNLSVRSCSFERLLIFRKSFHVSGRLDVLQMTPIVYHAGNNPRDVPAICACPRAIDKFVWLIEHLRQFLLELNDLCVQLDSECTHAVLSSLLTLNGPKQPFFSREGCYDYTDRYCQRVPKNDRHQRRVLMCRPSSAERGSIPLQCVLVECCAFVLI